MTVAELIAELQNFPMTAKVHGYYEEEDWIYNGESSECITSVKTGEITNIEKRTDYEKKVYPFIY